MYMHSHIRVHDVYAFSHIGFMKIGDIDIGSCSHITDDTHPRWEMGNIDDVCPYSTFTYPSNILLSNKLLQHYI